jgi:uncharacterized protein (DUF4213/DUF364 family)
VIPEGIIAQRLVAHLAERAEAVHVADIRIGRGYVGVVLDNNRMGIAASPKPLLPMQCAIFPGIQGLIGAKSSVVLRELTGKNDLLGKSIGLATANALIPPASLPAEENAVDLMHLTRQDHVVMVGLFRSLAQEITAKGITLSVVEQDRNKTNLVSRKDEHQALKASSVAIITATAILNNTMENILGGLGNPRHVAIIGPSTPLCAEVFTDMPVTHLGGAVILDQERVLQIIDESGGTPAMRPYLRFSNIVL